MRESPEATPLRRGWSARGRIRLFETVRLNAVGWTALLAPGVAVGARLGRVTGAAIGGAGDVLLAVVVDRMRHLRSAVNYGVDDPEGAALLLNQLGVTATPGAHGPSNEEVGFVTVQQRYLRKVNDDSWEAL